MTVYKAAGFASSSFALTLSRRAIEAESGVK